MTALCLTPAELVEVTGYRRKSKQLWWLRANKVPHKANALGKPVVSRAQWENTQGKATRSAGAQPNWTARD